MTTIWPLPQIEIQDLSALQESRPAAVLTGKRSWEAVSSLLKLPIVVQAEPLRADQDYLEKLASGLPEQVK